MSALHFFKVDLRAKNTHFYLAFIIHNQSNVQIYTNLQITFYFVFFSIINTIYPFIYKPSTRLFSSFYS